MRDGQHSRDDDNEAKLKGPIKDIGALDRYLILRTRNKGSCLTIQGTMVTSTGLLATEFRDFCARVMISHLLASKKMPWLLSVLLCTPHTKLQKRRTCHCMPQ